jgi:beta-phosphoglucomutase-like phosphatase (HAD superfamily)
VKKYILLDHDGVLVDTEFWYYKAGERALAEVGLALDKGSVPPGHESGPGHVGPGQGGRH